MCAARCVLLGAGGGSGGGVVVVGVSGGGEVQGGCRGECVRVSVSLCWGVRVSV